MTRKLLNLKGQLKPLEPAFDSTATLIAWLMNQAKEGDYLLAHAIDGVIWGRIEQGTLHTSHDVDSNVSPPLRYETLQQLRLFNAEREVQLWRDVIGWQARYATEAQQDARMDVIEERHILWGTMGTDLGNGFTLLDDGSQGLQHIVPIDATRVNERQNRAYLRVYHHLLPDKDTWVETIAYSRLVGIEVS